MQLSRQFADAFAYALDVHGGMMRQGEPYMAHLMGVTSLVLHYGGSEIEAIGALLHDAVEDAGGHDRLADIKDTFGGEVARIVEGCSDNLDDGDGAWLVRKQRYVNRVPDEPASVILVSAADKIYNVGAIIEDYREQGEALFAKREGGKAGRIGYYRGLVTAYRATGHHPGVIDDLDRLVTELEALCGMQGEWPVSRRV
jgi:GTP pyrophosphokinase